MVRLIKGKWFLEGMEEEPKPLEDRAGGRLDDIVKPLGKMIIPGFGQRYLDNVLVDRIRNINARKFVAYGALTFGQLMV